MLMDQQMYLQIGYKVQMNYFYKEVSDFVQMNKTNTFD